MFPLDAPAIIYRPLSIFRGRAGRAGPWFDLNLNFGRSYIHAASGARRSDAEGSSPRCFLALLPPVRALDVHPVNYFVSGYLQRAVNSCRADYTDRFIALVSQSNVRNAPPAAARTSPRRFSSLPQFSQTHPPLVRQNHPLLRGFRFRFRLFRLRRFSHSQSYFSLLFPFFPGLV